METLNQHKGLYHAMKKSPLHSQLTEAPLNTTATLTRSRPHPTRSHLCPLRRPPMSHSMVRLRGDDALMASMTEEQRRVATTFVTEMDQHGIGNTNHTVEKDYEETHAQS